ncbi:RNA-binding protein [Candidatus Woesearchaeota archaeon]|nr:RNA-binding protein [Candidatus Woesearchaeota archaeon]
MKQTTLSKRDIKDLNTEISKTYGVDDFFSKNDFMAMADDTYVMKDGTVMFFYKQDLLLPSLSLLLSNNFLKKIIVNMGAVPHVVRGADVMRPGIVGVDTYVKEKEIVVVVDENNLKPLAIGQSLFSKDEMQEMETGKMVLNLHYVGDEVWNYLNAE